MPTFTDTESRLWEILKDGEPHTLDELKKAVDEYCSTNNLRTHLSNMRKRLEPIGLNVIWQYKSRRPFIRLMRRVSNPSLE